MFTSIGLIDLRSAPNSMCCWRWPYCAHGCPAQAIERIELGLEKGAEPRALLESYLHRLIEEAPST